MELPSTTELRAAGVATPLCPVCHTVPLTGKQTVCSAKCRIQKSMKTRAAKRTDRDAKVRIKLREALDLLTSDDNPQPNKEDDDDTRRNESDDYQ